MLFIIIIVVYFSECECHVFSVFQLPGVLAAAAAAATLSVSELCIVFSVPLSNR